MKLSSLFFTPLEAKQFSMRESKWTNSDYFLICVVSICSLRLLQLVINSLWKAYTYNPTQPAPSTHLCWCNFFLSFVYIFILTDGNLWYTEEEGIWEFVRRICFSCQFLFFFFLPLLLFQCPHLDFHRFPRFSSVHRDRLLIKANKNTAWVQICHKDICVADVFSFLLKSSHVFL